MVLCATMESKKCDVLVVDTAGFIKSARLEDIGNKVRKVSDSSKVERFPQALSSSSLDCNPERRSV